MSAEQLESALIVKRLKEHSLDAAFLGAMPALRAQKSSGARMLLGETRLAYSNGPHYESILVVAQDSPLQSRAVATETLGQLKNKRIALVSPACGSGDIYPVSAFIKEGLLNDGSHAELSAWLARSLDWSIRLVTRTMTRRRFVSAKHRDFIVGVKARLSRNVTGAHDVEVLQRAQMVAKPFQFQTYKDALYNCFDNSEVVTRNEPLLVGSDNRAVEVLPETDPQLNGPAHQILIVVNGIHLLGRMKLDELAAKRAYEFAFVVQPLKIRGGSGSTVAPVAIR